MPNIYPSLDSHGGPLTEPVDVVPAILKHIFAQPGRVSNIFDNFENSPMCSIRMLESEYGHSPAEMVNVLQNKLKEIINRYFPGRDIQPEVTYSMHDDKVRYDVIIDVKEIMSNGTVEPVVRTNTITINPKTHEFTIEYSHGR